MLYTHTQLWLNNRSITLASIKQGDSTAQSEFEKSCLDFIFHWLNDRQTFVLQTSGSTGSPKQIEVKREQLIASAESTIAALGLKENDQALVCLPTQYIAGIMMLVRCLVGNLVIAAVEPSANPLSKLPSDKTIDFAALVPYQAENIYAEMGLEGFSRIKQIIVGGAPVSAKLMDILNNAPSTIYQTYGMTETLSHIALQKISGTEADRCFKSLPGVRLAIDERNCLIIHVSYLPQAIITNDVVEMISDNSFLWLGRADHIINSGGVKVYPEKVEKQVEKVFDLLSIGKRFFIAGTPDEKLGTKVTLIIESIDKIDQEEVIELLREHLKSHELPKSFLYANTFEMTPTNKINRLSTLQKIL